MTKLPNIDDGRYTYHRHEALTKNLQTNAHKLSPEVPCRFLTSKGKKKRALAPDRVTIPPQGDEYDATSSDRITIRYPLGSTYNLRKSYLLPILQDDHQIIVSPETDYYRRMAVVHTQPNDAFIEIGCDFGFTVGIVECDRKLGIDKSSESIGIARDNYPALDLLEVDVLSIPEEEMGDILTQKGLRDADVEGGLIVAIDINGNRELEAVIACLERVLSLWMPRLVIVKSRTLYNLLVKEGI